MLMCTCTQHARGLLVYAYSLTNTLVLQDPSADVNVAGMVAGM